jgi:hypothetical protein
MTIARVVQLLEAQVLCGGELDEVEVRLASRGTTLNITIAMEKQCA